MPNFGSLAPIGYRAVIENLGGFRNAMSTLTRDVQQFGTVAEQTAAQMDNLRQYTDRLGFEAANLGSKLLEITKGTLLVAARNEELALVIQNVGSMMGYTSEQVTAYDKSVQDMGIQIDKSRELLLLFAQAELDWAHAADLARVAQDLAVVGMKNSSDAARDLTYAISSQNTRILRQYGITANMTEIMRRYEERQIGAAGAVTDHSQKIDKLVESLQLDRDKLKLLQTEYAKLTSARVQDTKAIFTKDQAITRLVRKIKDNSSKLEDLREEHGKLSKVKVKVLAEYDSEVKKMAILNYVLEEGAKLTGTYETAMTTFSKQLRSIPRYVHEMSQELGKHLLPPMTQAIFLFTDFVKWVKELPEPILKAISQFTAFSGVLFSVGGAFLLLLPRLVSTFYALRQLPSILALLPNILRTTLLSPLGLIMGALTGLTVAWIFNWGGIRDKTKEIWETYIKPVFESIKGWLNEAIPFYLAVVWAVWETIWGAIGQSVQYVWDTYLKDFADDVAGFLEGIPGALDTLRKAWEEKWPVIEQHIAGFAEKVGEWLGPVVEWLQTDLPNALTYLRDEWAKRWPEIRQTASTVWNTLVAWWTIAKTWLSENLPAAGTALLTAWSTVWPAIQSVFSTAWELVWTGLKNAYAWLSENIPTAIDTFKKAWDEKIPTLKQKFSEFWDDYLHPALETIDKFFRETIPAAIETLKTAFAGLSTAYEEGGFSGVITLLQETVEQLWTDVGGDEFVNQVGETVSTLFQNIVDKGAALFKDIDLPTALETIKGKVEGFIDKLRENEYVAMVGEKVREFFTNLWDKGADLVQSTDWSLALETIKNKVSTFLDGLQVPEFLKQAAEKFKAFLAKAWEDGTGLLTVENLTGAITTLKTAIGGFLDQINAQEHIDAAAGKVKAFFVGAVGTGIGLMQQVDLGPALTTLKERIGAFLDAHNVSDSLTTAQTKFKQFFVDVITNGAALIVGATDWTTAWTNLGAAIDEIWAYLSQNETIKVAGESVKTFVGAAIKAGVELLTSEQVQAAAVTLSTKIDELFTTISGMKEKHSTWQTELAAVYANILAGVGSSFGESWTNQIIPAFNAIIDGINQEGFVDYIANNQEELGKPIGAAFRGLIDGAVGGAELTYENLPGLATAYAQFEDAFIESWTVPASEAVTNAIGNFLTTTVSGVAGYLAGNEEAKAAADKALQPIRDFLKISWENESYYPIFYKIIKTFMETVIQGGIDAFAAAIPAETKNAIREIMEDILVPDAAIWGELLQAWKDLGTLIPLSMAAGIGLPGAREKLFHTLVAMNVDIEELLPTGRKSNLQVKDLEEIGRKLPLGLKEGLEDKTTLDKIKDALNDIAQFPKTIFEDEWEMESPSLLGDRYGRNFTLGVAEGLIEGLADNIVSKEAYIREQMAMVAEMFMPEVQPVKDAYQEMLSAQAEAINQFVQESAAFGVARIGMQMEYQSKTQELLAEYEAEKAALIAANEEWRVAALTQNYNDQLAVTYAYYKNQYMSLQTQYMAENQERVRQIKERFNVMKKDAIERLRLTKETAKSETIAVLTATKAQVTALAATMKLHIQGMDQMQEYVATGQMSVAEYVNWMFKELEREIDSMWDGLQSGVDDTLDQITLSWDDSTQPMLDTIGEVGDKAKQAGKAASDPMKAAADTVKNLAEMIDKAIESFKLLGRTSLDVVKLKESWRDMYKIIRLIVMSMGKLFASLPKKQAEGLGGFSDALGGIPELLVDFLELMKLLDKTKEVKASSVTTGIMEVFDVIEDVAKELAKVSKQFGKKTLERATAFGETSEKAMAGIGKAISALSALAEFKPAGALKGHIEKVHRIIAIIVSIVQQFAAANPMLKGLRGSASKFAEVSEEIVKPISAMIKAVVALADTEKIRDVEPAIEAVTTVVEQIVIAFHHAMQRIMDEGDYEEIFALAQFFAKGVSAIVSPIKTAIEAIGSLSDYEAPAKGYEKRVRNIAGVLKAIIKEFAAAADGFIDPDMIDPIKAFSTAAGAITGMMGDGIEAITTLAVTKLPPVSRVKNEIKKLAHNLLYIVARFRDIVKDFTLARDEEIVKFVDVAESIVGIIAEGVDAIIYLAQHKLPAVAKVRDASKRFAKHMRRIVLDFRNLALDLGTKAETIEVFAAVAGEIVGMVSDGIDAIKALAETKLPGVWEIRDKVLNFAHHMRQIVQVFRDLSMDVRAQIERIESFSSAVESITATVEGGLKALKDLTDVVFPNLWDIRENVLIFAYHMRQIVQVFRDIALDLTEDESTTIEAFSSAIEQISGTIEGGIAGLKELGKDSSEWLIPMDTIRENAFNLGVRFREIVEAFKIFADTTEDEATSISTFLDAVGSIVGTIADGMAALVELGKDSSGWMIDLDTLWTNAHELATRLWDLVDEFEDVPALPEATVTNITNFTTAVGDITGMIGPAMEGLVELGKDSAGWMIDLDVLWTNIHELATRLEALVDEFDDVIVISDDDVENISNFASAAGDAAGLIGQGIEALASLGDWDLSAALDLETVFILAEELALRLRKVVDAFKTFAVVDEDLDPVRNFASAAGEVAGIIAQAIEAITALADYSGDVTTIAADLIAEDLNTLVDAIDDIAITWEEDVLDATARFAKAAGEVGSGISGAVAGLVALSEYTTKQSNLANAILDQFVLDMQNIVKKIYIARTVLTEDGLEEARKFAAGAGEIFSAAQSGLSFLSSLAKYVAPTEAKVQEFIAGVEEIVSLVIEALEVIFTLGERPEVPGPLDMLTQGYNLTITWLRGMVNGIAVGSTDVLQAIRELVASMIGETEEGLGVQSPSDIFEDIGWDTIQGLVNGILAAARDALQALEKIVGDLVGTVDDGGKNTWYDAGKNTAEYWLKGLADGLTEGLPKIAEVLALLQEFFPSSPAKRGPLRKTPNWSSWMMNGFNSAIGNLNSGLEGLGPTKVSGMRGGGSAITNNVTRIFQPQINANYANAQSEASIRSDLALLAALEV
jgi:hypothetical protein